MIRFRNATRDDVEAVVRLLGDDTLGADREQPDLSPYHGAFDAMMAEGNNHLIVGEDQGQIIATYQITFISGLSLRATRRAQIESVRVASEWRDQGIGTLMMADAEGRARRAGCTLIQLTTNRARQKAHDFYERLGFTPSHIGFKRELS